VGSAEGGEEVVEGVLVGQVQDGECEVGFVAIAVEQVVPAEGEIEHVARGDAGRVPVVVLGAGCGDFDERRGEAAAGATRERRREGCADSVAGEFELGLLIG
jgi:hypothetical protein